MGTFRDRIDEELRLRGYAATTRETYLRIVRAFVRSFMRPPDQLTLEHINRYQLDLTRRRLPWVVLQPGRLRPPLLLPRGARQGL